MYSNNFYQSLISDTKLSSSTQFQMELCDKASAQNATTEDEFNLTK
jgi:hypothetical protein